MVWRRWQAELEVLGLAVALWVVAASAVLRLSPAERRQIELEAGLEQLQALEQQYFAATHRYFDPTRRDEGLAWSWMDGFDWEYQAAPGGFRLLVRADVDGDGEPGVWSIEAGTPGVRQLAGD